MYDFPWLPVSKEEIIKKGWNEVDVIIVTGDAYVDHPAFGAAVIGRILEREKLRVAVIPQPNWRDDLRDFRKLGKPRLFFAVTSGNMDSMVNHYTSFKRLRSDDAYTSGGKAGFRPDYAVKTYTKILKSLYPETPVIIGGIEASLRRLVHYDYWSGKLLPSILIDSGADILVYGMAEKPMIRIAETLRNNESLASLYPLRQIAYVTDDKNFIHLPENIRKLPSYEECLNNKVVFAKSYKVIEEISNRLETDTVIIQKHGNKAVIVNPPYPQISTQEFDSYYELPYSRQPHPKYKKRGEIPAFTMIKDSLTVSRGCFGGCSFCSISIHQGKFVAGRSENSVLKEAGILSSSPEFKGHITDVGGPSANMYQMKGYNLETCGNCIRYSCIFPGICGNLDTNPVPLKELYRKIREIKGVNKVTVGSGIRYDINILSREYRKEHLAYLEELIKHHVSGRLKVAPEHSEEQVLNVMRKPGFDIFLRLREIFRKVCSNSELNLQLVPYFISGHPGCGISEMAELAVQIRQNNLLSEQVQDFMPTPMTLSSVIYYSGIDPYSGKKVLIPDNIEEKYFQKDFFFLNNFETRKAVKKKLMKSGRHNIVKRLKL